jgi:cytochrome P450
VIEKVLRLLPVAPFDSRMMIQDTVLSSGGGQNGTFPILKGDIMMTSPYALHRLSLCFASDSTYPAENFCPGRWGKVRPGWAYMPFGGG